MRSPPIRRSPRRCATTSCGCWWCPLATVERPPPPQRLAGEEIARDGGFVIEGRLFAQQGVRIAAWGTSSRAPEAHAPGATVTLATGQRLRVAADGAFALHSPRPAAGTRLPRVFVTAAVPPSFTLENFRAVLGGGGPGQGIGRAFLNTLTVAIPATAIPILAAAFAAYALAWMEFPGRAPVEAAVVGLMVVPLGVALIPLLQLHNGPGIGKGYPGVWLAHTGFGMPLAIWQLHTAMAGRPRDPIKAARLDGAGELAIFRRIALPLCRPAVAALAIFQFLWTWNDLLVALVFLGTGEDRQVLTGHLVNLMGSRGGEWEILAASVFVAIAVPPVVFFTMQRYLVRGLLAGSVK